MELWIIDNTTKIFLNQKPNIGDTSGLYFDADLDCISAITRPGFGIYSPEKESYLDMFEYQINGLEIWNPIN